MNGTQATSGNVLCWPKRLLSAEDLRRHLNGQRELMLLPKTVVTPLALDELRAKGVRIVWQPAGQAPTESLGGWIYMLERPDAMVLSAIKALERDGIRLVHRAEPTRAFADTIVRDQCTGGILFTINPLLAACIANKISGIRAAVAANVAQARQARKSFAANCLAIETPGPGFFELRQMLRTITTADGECPAGVATILKELDGHAHR